MDRVNFAFIRTSLIKYVNSQISFLKHIFSLENCLEYTKYGVN